MKYTGKPVMKSALWAYESAAVAAHEIPPNGGTKAARCAAYSAFTGVKAELTNCRFVEEDLIMPTRVVDNLLELVGGYGRMGKRFSICFVICLFC